jgi:hypothetical protein
MSATSDVADGRNEAARMYQTVESMAFFSIARRMRIKARFSTNADIQMTRL